MALSSLFLSALGVGVLPGPEPCQQLRKGSKSCSRMARDSSCICVGMSSFPGTKPPKATLSLKISPTGSGSSPGQPPIKRHFFLFRRRGLAQPIPQATALANTNCLTKRCCEPTFRNDSEWGKDNPLRCQCRAPFPAYRGRIRSQNLRHWGFQCREPRRSRTSSFSLASRIIGIRPIARCSRPRAG